MAHFIEIAECKDAGKMSQKTFIDITLNPVFTWRKDLDEKGNYKDLALIVNGIEHKESTCVCFIKDTNGKDVQIPMSAAINLLYDKNYYGALKKYRRVDIFDCLVILRNK